MGCHWAHSVAQSPSPPTAPQQQVVAVSGMKKVMNSQSHKCCRSNIIFGTTTQNGEWRNQQVLGFMNIPKVDG